MSQARVSWVDTLKAIGIISIYIGHFLSAGGLSQPFIFAYAVQLFFFTAGFFAVGKETSLLKWSIRKWNTIMLPYFFFTALTLIVSTLQENMDFATVGQMLIKSILGVRNQTAAPSLWFLPCLFCMSVLYAALYKLLHKKWLLLLVSLALSLWIAFTRDPVSHPAWFWNLDSALYYMVFYALGASLFLPLQQVTKMKLKNRDRIMVVAAGLLLTTIAGMDYFGKMLPIYQMCMDVPLFPQLYPLLIAAFLIAFFFLLAVFLQHFDAVSQIGAETLYLCGNEYIIKTVVSEAASMFGVEIQFKDPFVLYLYTAFLILISCRSLIPFEKRLYKRVGDVFFALSLVHRPR